MSKPQASLIYQQPVLVLGPVPVALPQLYRELGKGRPLVAVDGGANQLLGSEVYPDAIIGDLDSLQHRENWAKRCQLISIDEQNSTDFEKCLYSVQAPSYIALGFVGRRLDHTLANLHVLAKQVRSQPVVLLGEHDITVVCQGDFILALGAGLRISVFPLSPVCFTRSAGLRYPLDGLALAVGAQIGTSNETCATAVEIIPVPGDNGLYALSLPLQAQEAIEAWSHARGNRSPLV